VPSKKKLRTVLKNIRKTKGWSQRELAEKAETTGAYIAMLETGKKRNPSLAVLKRLARVLDVPITDLLG
jgi:XRE family transcriptional regulator of biofilm formation